MTREVKIGSKVIGGANKIAIQSMNNKRPDDFEGNIEQAIELERAGCDINRIAIPNEAALKLIPLIKNATTIPLVADIHFDYRLAIKSVEAGIDKIRFNPGNIGSDDKAKMVVDCCKRHDIPIRIGVNSGSVEKELLQKHGGPCGEALFESAIRHVRIIEDSGYNNIVISMKSAYIKEMLVAYRLAAKRLDYPLHLGVTEAGTKDAGTIKSAIGIGSLLADGIGATIRVSLTGDPIYEIAAAKSILGALELTDEVHIVSCPTCGRTDIDIISIANELEVKTRHIKKNITVAVMGCVVNGPGEASNADLGIAGGKDSAVLFRKGKKIRKITDSYVDELIKEIEGWKQD